MDNKKRTKTRKVAEPKNITPFDFMEALQEVMPDDSYKNLIDEIAKLILTNTLTSENIIKSIENQLTLNQQPTSLDEIKEYIVILMVLEAISETYSTSIESAKKIDKLLTSLFDDLTQLVIKYIKSGVPPSAISIVFFKMMGNIITPELSVEIHNKIKELTKYNSKIDNSAPPSGYL